MVHVLGRLGVKQLHGKAPRGRIERDVNALTNQLALWKRPSGARADDDFPGLFEPGS